MKTSTNQNKAVSQKAFLTGNVLPNVKLLSILFIALLNISKVSAQPLASMEPNPALIYPAFHNKAGKSLPTKTQQKVYTVFAAKKFPKIESADKNGLMAKDISESFDYEILFCTATVKNTNADAIESLTHIANTNTKENINF